MLNKLKVVKVDLNDPYEGIVTFETIAGKRFAAFFWGQEFEINVSYLVSFSSLDRPIEWETVFSENQTRKMTIEYESGECSYLAYGQILSINPVIADFGDIILEIGELTHDDTVIGEFIFWKIDRLDVLEIKNCAQQTL